MKPVWPAEPTLSIPMLLDGVSSNDAVICTTKQGFFYADMLPVMVFMSFMSILYIIVIKSKV